MTQPARGDMNRCSSQCQTSMPGGTGSLMIWITPRPGRRKRLGLVRPVQRSEPKTLCGLTLA